MYNISEAIKVNSFNQACFYVASACDSVVRSS
jgi:hypothetical protein